jgi:hypothetical protein
MEEKPTEQQLINNLASGQVHNTIISVAPAVDSAVELSASTAVAESVNRIQKRQVPYECLPLCTIDPCATTEDPCFDPCATTEDPCFDPCATTEDPCFDPCATTEDPCFDPCATTEDPCFDPCATTEDPCFDPCATTEDPCACKGR